MNSTVNSTVNCVQIAHAAGDNSYTFSVHARLSDYTKQASKP